MASKIDQQIARVLGFVKAYGSLSDRLAADEVRDHLAARTGGEVGPDVSALDTHWAVKNPGKADQYRREAEAARVALGFSANSDDVSPREITDSIQAIKAGDRQTVSALVEALESLLDMQDEDCRYDHEGYCQSHNLDHVDDGCRVARAKAALAATTSKEPSHDNQKNDT